MRVSIRQHWLLALIAVTLLTVQLACEAEQAADKAIAPASQPAVVDADLSAPNAEAVTLPKATEAPQTDATSEPAVPGDSSGTPAASLANAPTRNPLPDLIAKIEAELKPNPRIEYGDDCIVSSSARLPFYVSEITAYVRNVGGGDAGSFMIQLNDEVTETVDGLKAGAGATVVVTTSARSENVAVVDAGSSIDESDESNNTAKTSIPLPTIVPPAPTCTPG